MGEKQRKRPANNRHKNQHKIARHRQEAYVYGNAVKQHARHNIVGGRPAYGRADYKAGKICGRACADYCSKQDKHSRKQKLHNGVFPAARQNVNKLPKGGGGVVTDTSSSICSAPLSYNLHAVL